jgi:hypothetical protein
LIFGAIGGLLGLLSYYYWPQVWAKIFLAILIVFSIIGLASGAGIFALFWGALVSIVVGALIGEPKWKTEEVVK